MDKKKLGRCIAYGAAAGALTAGSYLIGSEIGYEQGALAVEKILGSDLNGEILYAAYTPEIQAGCRIIGGNILAAMTDTVGLGMMYAIEKKGLPICRNLKEKISRKP